MKTNEPIILSRDCEAIQIPSGEKFMLPACGRAPGPACYGQGSDVAAR